MAEPHHTDPVGGIADQIAELVRREIAHAKEELRESAKSAGLGGGMIGAAGVAGLYGGASIIAAAVLLLSRRLPPWVSAAIVGAGVSAAGAVLARRGIGKVREASALPRETIRETRETLDGTDSAPVP
ncbi:phage holin family protein [Amycolatopsis sp. NPDC026612]|uniref:phage holin family protein n=1 Tax=Amycolatopsis sp. NPDC026612 TaxID=3155466 RepID=UPI0033DBBC96